METKKCSKCGEVKSVLEFNKKTEKLTQCKCKTCQHKYHKEWYEKNKQKRKNQIKEYKKNNMNLIKKTRLEYTLKKYKEKQELKDLTSLKIKFIKDLNFINNNRFVNYCGEKKDLLNIDNSEFLKIFKLFFIKGVYQNELKIIKEVRDAVGN